MPPWFYLGIFMHVVVAIIFITGLLYYHFKANTVTVKYATAVNKYLLEYGYEAAPFIPEWYNKMSNVAQLELDPKTACVIVLSNATMFEKTLPAFLDQHDPDLTKGEDCVDLCTKFFMEKARSELFPEEEVDIIYDYELDPRTKLPRINMCTAGHAAGMAYYNRPEEVESPPWGEKKMFGCAVSPKYGGHFAFRAVFVFKNVKDPDILFLSPHDAVDSEEDKIQLLEAFNGDWKNPAWRNIIQTDLPYSEEQIEYFNMAPGERLPILKSLLDRHKEESEEDKKNQ